jgi:hypothetical protein
MPRNSSVADLRPYCAVRPLSPGPDVHLDDCADRPRVPLDRRQRGTCAHAPHRRIRVARGSSQVRDPSRSLVRSLSRGVGKNANPQRNACPSSIRTRRGPIKGSCAGIRTRQAVSNFANRFGAECSRCRLALASGGFWPPSWARQGFYQDTDGPGIGTDVRPLTPATAPTPRGEDLDQHELERMARVGVVALSFAGIRKA